MVRAQDPQGEYIPTHDDAWVRGQWVRYAESSGTGALKSLSLNSNTRWANQSPLWIAQSCHDATANHLSYALAAWSNFEYAWQLTVGNESRSTMRWALWVKSDAGTTGQVEIASSVNTGGASVFTVNTAGVWTWVEGSRHVTADGNGNDILTCRIRRTAGAGSLYLRSMSAWIRPYAGNLPSGIEVGGNVAHDALETDADAGLHVQWMRRERANLQAGIDGAGLPYPVMGWSQRLSLAQRMTGWYSDNAEYRVVGIPLLVPRQWQVSQLRYHLLGNYTGANGNVRIRNLSTGDSHMHTLPTGNPWALAPVTANWKTGVLEMRPKPIDYAPEILMPDIVVLDIKADAPQSSAIYAITLQEEAR